MQDEETATIGDSFCCDYELWFDGEQQCYLWRTKDQIPYRIDPNEDNTFKSFVFNLGNEEMSASLQVSLLSGLLLAASLYA